MNEREERGILLFRVRVRARKRAGYLVLSPVTDEICAGRQREGETEPKQIET